MKEQSNLLPNDAKTITFYNRMGKILGIVLLPEATTHKERCSLSKVNGIKKWHHYSIRDTHNGMKRRMGWHYSFKLNSICPSYYKIDPKTGRIINRVY